MRRQWLFWIILFSFLGSPALAHSWYDTSCCSGYDCHQIPLETVKVTREGYQVTIPPGVHDRAPNGWSELVPYRINGTINTRIRNSGDSEYHACISPAIKDHILCLYRPPGGV